MAGIDTNKEVIELCKEKLEPNTQTAYRKQIATARSGIDALKGTEPVGVIPKGRMPSFAKDYRSSPSPISEDGGVRPRPAGAPPIRPETIEEIQGFAKASAKEAEEERKKAEEKKSEEKAQELKDDLFDALDFDGRSEAEKILNNKKRRLAIESRCEPMNFEDLIWKNEVQQKVPIKPGEFEPVFRSLTPSENLFIKAFISKESITTDMYIMEKMGLCQLTCSLVSVNGRDLPPHRDQNGEIKDDLFKAKLAKVMAMSGYIIADLGLNYTWFDLRVRRLINPDALGNG